MPIILCEKQKWPLFVQIVQLSRGHKIRVLELKYYQAGGYSVITAIKCNQQLHHSNINLKRSHIQICYP
jgi:hypothetical protein